MRLIQPVDPIRIAGHPVAKDLQSLAAEGRAAYERRDWEAALRLLREADGAGPLGPGDLRRLALAAHWAGEIGAVLEPLERAYATYAARDETAAAARIALTLSAFNADRRQAAASSGWRALASSLLDGLPECGEHGLLAWLEGRSRGTEGDVEGHLACAEQACEIGARHGDADVEALGWLDRGHALLTLGRVREGIPFLDRAAALAVSGRLGLFTGGTIYCGVIWACRCRGDWGRAREWTATVERWCSRERIGYFPGICRMHRAEVLRMAGELAEAEREAEAACVELEGFQAWFAAFAFAELGEVRRRRGDFAGAWEAFRRAKEIGRDPEPGLALLMAAQGDAPSALRAIHRALEGDSSIWVREDRASLLAARVTLALAAGERDDAREAAATLAAQGAEDHGQSLVAYLEGARGELAAADAELEDAVACFRRSLRAWSALDAPYEAASVRARLAEVLGRLGDARGAALELEAARTAFERIGARFEVERLATGEPDETRVESVVFHAEGDVWTIRFRDRTLRVKDSRGLRHIARLVANPGVEIPALELARDGDVPLPASDAGVRLDERARAEYRRRLADLRAELAEAEGWNDAGRGQRIRAEIEALTTELSGAVGLGGRARRERSDTERARQAVTKAIRAALRRIAQASAELAAILERRIRTGTTCAFEPDPLDRLQCDVADGSGLTS